MIKKVLVALFLFFVFALLITWVASGALRDIAARKDAFANPVGAFLRDAEVAPDFRVPPPTDIPTVSIPEPYDSFNGQRVTTYQGLRRSHLSEERERDAALDRLEEAQTFGDVSPERGTVYIETLRSRPTNTRPDEEHIIITASRSNTAPMDLSGWSLHSAVTGVRALLPRGVHTLRMGESAPLSPLTLAPGASAIITTGPSPVGTSFRLNSCVGYLDQFQNFYPSLPNSCLSPREELPNTLENVQTYGESCIDFVASLSRCTFYVGDFPSHLSNACRAFVKNALTYNGCVDRHQWRASFNQEDWRVYLEARSELWQNGHDVVRLLDESGRTVDAWSY